MAGNENNFVNRDDGGLFCGLLRSPRPCHHDLLQIFLSNFSTKYFCPLFKNYCIISGNENNFETMEACFVACGGPSDHPTTTFSFPTGSVTARSVPSQSPSSTLASIRGLTTASTFDQSTRRSLVFCKCPYSLI